MILRSALFWLPNVITFTRLLAVPVMVALMLEGLIDLAFWLFLAAGVSDAVDGFIAKRWRLVSTLGAYLDPLADKALLVAVTVTLGHMELVPLWLVILVVFRDLLIIGGAMLYQQVTQSLSMQPLFISKLNTAMQITLIAVILGRDALELGLAGLEGTLIWAVAATTFLSGAAYVIRWGRRALSLERQR